MAQLSGDAFAFGGELMRIEEALALVKDRIPVKVGSERVAITQADGRILAKPVLAPIDLPVFDNSAVDGYAVAYADLQTGAPTVLAVGGRVAAGHSAKKRTARGTATRIFTGAPMPPGTDTVFMQEDVRVLDDGRVELPTGLACGANRRLQGEDIAKGTEALPAGRCLEPRDIALLAALGITHLEVRCKPRVAVFSTGDEICEPGRKLPPAALYDSNRFTLMAMLGRAGCVVTDLGILKDDRATIAASLGAVTKDHDLIVTSGGVSTGEEDHVRAAIGDQGSLVFWRLAIKPGRPVAMAVLNGTPLVGLPGNPVAVFVTFTHVLRPLIAAISGATLVPPVRTMVISGFDYRKKAGRREYVRVKLERADGELIARKYPVEGAGVITSLTYTDGMIELAEERTKLTAGEPVPFIDYRQVM